MSLLASSGGKATVTTDRTVIGSNNFCRYLRGETTFPFDQPRDKTNKVACAPSEDSDQPGHPLSLIRVFAVHM